MIKTLPENVSGRDFVVGDLHGCFDLLQALLKHVDFKYQDDRLISVGDLIDRGPNSLKCLCLLDEPWFHCVKANHEQLMEDYLTGDPMGKWWFPNGGKWWFDLSLVEKHEVTRLLPVIQDLPWLITVEGPKKFHVIHAELGTEQRKKITDADLADEDKFKFFAMRYMGDGAACLWGRNLFGQLYGQFIDERGAKKLRKAYDMNPSFFNKELSHTYSGHTVLRQPTTIEGQTAIDTGSFSHLKNDWAGLTMTEPLSNRFWTAKRNGVQEVTPLIL